MRFLVKVKENAVFLIYSFHVVVFEILIPPLKTLLHFMEKYSLSLHENVVSNNFQLFGMYHIYLE